MLGRSASIGASHLQAHGRRIVTEGGVKFGLERCPWFAGLVRLAEAVSGASGPNLHGVDHIDFGKTLASNARPSSEAHSFSRCPEGLGKIGSIWSGCGVHGSSGLVFRAVTRFGVVTLGGGGLESKCRKRCDHQHPS